jgi:hypothetical protein
VTAPNLLLSLDDHLIGALTDVRLEAEDAMDRYVDAKRREAELSALLDIRKAMGAKVNGDYQVIPLKQESA